MDSKEKDRFSGKAFTTYRSVKPILDHDDEPGAKGNKLKTFKKNKVEEEIEAKNKELQDKKNLLKFAHKLPDKGEKILKTIETLEKELQDLHLKPKVEDEKEEIPEVVPEPVKDEAKTYLYIDWDKNTPAYYNFGKIQVTHVWSRQNPDIFQTLEMLLKDYEEFSNNSKEIKPPKSLQTNLLDHQKEALKWLLWRENHEPAGGILADDMGLGKTLTMISLILKSKARYLAQLKKTDVEVKDSTLKDQQTSLIICPLSLIHQWEGEVKKHCKEGALSTLIFHGPHRETDPKKLVKFDMVITTYDIVSNDRTKNNILSKITWKRVILDEGHNIKNHKIKKAEAIFALTGKHRWLMSGTPIQNNILEIYSYFKFLQLNPFDILSIWKQWTKTESIEKINFILQSILIRRTKDQTIDNKPLVPNLPKKNFIIEEIELSEKEKEVYNKLDTFSRAVYLKREDEKRKARDKDEAGTKYVSKVSGSYLLNLLLRLQQCCSHLHLLKKTIEECCLDTSIDSIASNLSSLSITQPSNDDDELEKLMSNLNVASSPISTNVTSPKREPETELEPSLDNLGLSNYIDDEDFEEGFKSTKIKMILKLLKKIKKDNEANKTRDKCIIVSQFTSFLNLIGYRLSKKKYSFHILDGSVPSEKRFDITTDFNENPDGPSIMLLSLKAGGVGLNLIGANHLFLVDLHWNPALESQAADRIYRVGQKKEVFIHKLVCKDTIEQRIKELQDEKRSLADSVLSGHSKLKNTEMKKLFGV